MKTLVAIAAVLRVLVPALVLLSVPSTTTWAAGGLAVTTPNGGQKWAIGKAYLINWGPEDIQGEVAISLTKAGRHYRWLDKRHKDGGGYVWKIPTSVSPGKNYKIKIKKTRGKSRETFSSNRYFTIKKKGGSPPSVNPSGTPPSDR